MLPDVERLLIVQERDQRILRFRKETQRLPLEETAAKNQLAGDQAAVEKAKSDIQHNEIEVHKLEIDVKTRQDTLARLRTQQFETRKNDEFQALGNEIKRYSGEIEKLEDAELVLMEKAEELSKSMDEAQTRLKATTGRVNEEVAAITERLKNSKAEIETLEAERAELIKDVPEDTASTYGRILKSKGNAIVPIEHGICTGCHMSVTATTQLKARTGHELVTCEQCGRIVFEGNE